MAEQPHEHDRASLARYLRSFDWEHRNAAITDALVRDGLPLWCAILDLVPRERRGKLLELGSPPFHITLLTQKLRDYEMTLTAAAVDGRPQLIQHVASAAYGEQYTFACTCFDLERDPFPFPDGEFDVVMWCEVIEHLTENPVFALSEIHRVLKPGGLLVLSTPNVASATNIARLLAGRNIYYPYDLGASLRGTRHSREYTLPELCDLLVGCGFRLDHAAALDLPQGTDRPWGLPHLALQVFRAVVGRLPGVHRDHLFVRGVKDGPFRWHFPRAIFDEGQLAWYLRVRDAVVVMGENDIPHTGPGWGAIEERHGVRLRALTGTASAFLVSDQPGRAVAIDLMAPNRSASPVDVQVWLPDGPQAQWVTSGHAELTPGERCHLRIELNPALPPSTQVHVRIVAAGGTLVQRIALLSDA